MEIFAQNVKFPDLWQREAIEALCAGKDVIVHAPTGAGKTYIFELFFTRHFKGSAVYTVPTRALANDKFREWRALGWNVGIATGDYSFNTSAPLVVATLETQKSRIFEGNCAGLIVIDEYQLISDFRRGVNYESVIAAAKKDAQLLLLSGSVANRQDVLNWLERLGRRAVLVEHNARPVPLDEVFSEAIDVSFSARGAWGRLARKIENLEMSPVLIFAPKRADAEIIAAKIAEEFKADAALELPREKLARAGRKLGRLLKRRVAFHHSGLGAYQRSELVEELAKSGQLRAVVATTGLGAGVNFSMRSVIISDREYEADGKTRSLRPDEMLQMYGRAGRRGLDKLGYAICLPSKPRLSDAREIVLERPNFLDWSAFLRVMQDAAQSGKDHIQAAKNFALRLFSKEKIDLGFEAAKRSISGRKSGSDGARIEMKNSQGLWQRRTPTSTCPLEEAMFFDGKKWIDFLGSKRALSLLKIGAVCPLPSKKFGLKVRIAAKSGENLFRLNKSIIAKLRKEIPLEDRAVLSPGGATLKTLRRRFLKYVPRLFAGARAEFLEVENDALFAVLNAKSCSAKAYKDSCGKYLFNPPMREVLVRNAYN
ncbi:MAG: DEAD/DEAH box helicase, partial [Opitutales bacterium]|nr:DEAD/DEAH box helicase [Opitutales bacterium]